MTKQQQTLLGKIPKLKNHYLTFIKNSNQLNKKNFAFLQSKNYLVISLLIFPLAFALLIFSLAYPIPLKPFISISSTISFIFFVTLFFLGFLSLFLRFSMSFYSKKSLQNARHLANIYHYVFKNIPGLVLKDVDFSHNLDYRKLIKKRFASFSDVTFLSPIFVFDYRNVKNIKAQVLKIEVVRDNFGSKYKRAYEYVIGEADLNSQTYPKNFSYSFKDFEDKKNHKFYATPDHVFNRKVGLVTNQLNFSELVDERIYNFFLKALSSRTFQEIRASKRGNNFEFSFQTLGPSIFLLWYNPFDVPRNVDAYFRIVMQSLDEKLDLLQALLLPLLMERTNKENVNSMFPNSEEIYFSDTQKVMLESREARKRFFDIHYGARNNVP